MTTTIADLKYWHETGVTQGKTHMIIVCDTFDWEDYPVYAESPKDCMEKYRQYGPGNTNMQKVMEVYDLSKPFVEHAQRVWDLPWEQLKE